MPWPCYDCGAELFSRKALAGHLFKAHGVKKWERRLCTGTVCQACLKDFWSRDRLVRHIAFSSEKCGRVLAARGPVLTQVEAELEDLEWRGANRELVRRGLASTKAAVPFVVLEGPLPYDASCEGITH